MESEHLEMDHPLKVADSAHESYSERSRPATSWLLPAYNARDCYRCIRLHPSCGLELQLPHRVRVDPMAVQLLGHVPAAWCVRHSGGTHLLS